MLIHTVATFQDPTGTSVVGLVLLFETVAVTSGVTTE